MTKQSLIFILLFLNCFNLLSQKEDTFEIHRIKSLFDNLSKEDKEIAQNSFIQLTTNSPEIVLEEIRKKTYPYNDDNRYNIWLPTFTIKFLKQLVLYTKYCKENNISFNKNHKLKSNILQLRDYTIPSDFSKKYALENKILKDLSFDDISELEYLGLVYMNEYPITFSIGRILDIFYSKKFDSILSNPNYTKHYLKKSALFDNLGIIGICNNYRYKFYNCNSVILDSLKKVYSLDKDILEEIKKIKEIKDNHILNSKTIDWKIVDTFNYHIPNIEKTLNFFKSQENNITEQISDSLFEVISWTHYKQIPIVLNFLENSKFSKNKIYYRFLEDDFGFFTLNSSQVSKNRYNFLKTFNSTNEEVFYKTLLDDAGIDYKKQNDSLDFNKIYNILKHDIVEPFVGGGGMTYDYQTFAVIRLLQLHFKTRLGFSNKQCRSRKWYSCSNDQNCCAWMDYLTKNKIVDSKNIYPISFHNVKKSYERR